MHNFIKSITCLQPLHSWNTALLVTHESWASPQSTWLCQHWSWQTWFQNIFLSKPVKVYNQYLNIWIYRTICILVHKTKEISRAIFTQTCIYMYLYIVSSILYDSHEYKWNHSKSWYKIKVNREWYFDYPVMCALVLFTENHTWKTGHF